MSAIPASKIAIGIVAIVFGGGTVLLIAHENSAPHSAVSEVADGPLSLPPTVHTAAWYVAHPDVLKADEQRCAGDAATMTPAACQNVASADTQMAGADYAKAAATLNADANGKQTPKPQ